MLTILPSPKYLRPFPSAFGAGIVAWTSSLFGSLLLLVMCPQAEVSVDRGHNRAEYYHRLWSQSGRRGSQARGDRSVSVLHVSLQVMC